MQNADQVESLNRNKKKAVKQSSRLGMVGDVAERS